MKIENNRRWKRKLMTDTEQDPRMCVHCGRNYDPRNDFERKQRTCDECFVEGVKSGRYD